MLRFLLHSVGPFFRSFVRTPLQSVGTILLLSLLFFVMYLLLMLGFGTQKTISFAEAKIDMTFFFEKEVPSHKKELVFSKLESLKKKGEIESYRYISEEDSVKAFAEKYPEKFSYWKKNASDQNPLTASFDVVPKNWGVSQLVEYFSSEEFSGAVDVSRLAQTEEQRQRTMRVLDMLRVIEKSIFSFTIVIFLAIASVTAAFISSSFIVRRQEIFIMRLVGASYSFIRAPFLVEGTLFSLISATIGLLFFEIFRQISIQKILSLFSSVSDAKLTVEVLNTIFADFFHSLFTVFPLSAAFALIASFITIERFLRKEKVFE